MNAVTFPEVRPIASNGIRALSALVRWRFVLCFSAVLVIGAWNGFWHLGETLVRDWDEARYGVAASEMLHSHSALITTYAGATEFWNLKPPLGYWLLEASLSLAGETPLALRLPAALCALLSIALTMLFARRIAGARVAILAGAVLATAFGFLGHHGARSGELDGPLALLLLAFLVLAPSFGERREARLAGGLVVALGFLLKSFEILPYVAAIALYWLARRGFASWRVWPLPLGIALGIAATWAVARSVAEDSWEFVRRMFIEDLVLRTTAVIDPGQDNSAWDYIGTLIDRIAPWPIVVLLALRLSNCHAERRLGAESRTLLWCYALVPLVLFTLAQTHHFQYILPTFPVWAILAAISITRVLERAERAGYAAAAAGLVLICLIACEARVTLHAMYDRMSPAQAFLASLPARLGDADRHIRTGFVTTYTERFFLQVVDGYSVDDTVARGAVPQAPAAHGLLLMRTSPENLDVQPSRTDARLVAQGEGYALYRYAPQPP